MVKIIKIEIREKLACEVAYWYALFSGNWSKQVISGEVFGLILVFSMVVTYWGAATVWPPPLRAARSRLPR